MSREGSHRARAAVLLAVIAFTGTPYSQGDADWTEPFPPFKIAGNLYYVGSRGLASYLITTVEGHILINSDVEASVPLIQASVEKLGFRFTDIRILLISHAHRDHAAASDTIKRATGATYMVMDADVPVVESGGKTDCQYGKEPGSLYTPTKVDRVLHDGDEVKLGGELLVAHLTPGHTKGCTTWTMKVREAGKTKNVVIVGGPNVNPGYRLVNDTAYPQIATDYKKTFRVLKSLPCDIFLGAHGSYFGLESKYARLTGNPRGAFVDPEGYRKYVTEREQAFESELERQSGQVFDVVHYDAQVEPDIVKGTVAGKVSIQFVSRVADLAEIELDRGDLVIDAVRARGEAQVFATVDHRVRIELSRPAAAGERREIEVDYHGAPRRGIRFFPEREQVYTVFATSQWLVCVDAPDDKATLRLRLILPAHLSSVANGRLVAQHPLPNNRNAYEWWQEKPVPTYTFGFAAGRFHVLAERHGSVQLRYLATEVSDEDLRRIFGDTPDMLDFYEARAGVRYADATYTQVLAGGGVEQEMSSFAVLRDTYGAEVLANERDIWLGAHELAHQWWGNMVTCRAWTDFWLNEGMANFMTAAYFERRFGREEYVRQIEEYRASYQKVRETGKDRSLVFPDWLHPTADDRTLVYDKGAYVLHLLREELGEGAFWAGIRYYTREYFGKSGTTADFQSAMERASGKRLTAFFAKWIYATQADAEPVAAEHEGRRASP